MAPKPILEILKGGDRRSNRGADKAVAIVATDPKLFAELIKGMWHEDRLLRMRAADAAEKITRANDELLRPHKRSLLALLREAEEQELRWHLAVIVPRLPLTRAERQLAFADLERYLEDRSSIVKTFALQGMVDFARQDTGLQGRVLELLRDATRKGTPAMKSRSRKLLLQLEEIREELA